MRSLISVALLSLFLASPAQAKLKPSFSERVVEVGDLVALDVGDGSEQFLGPLRIDLVPLEAADQLQDQTDSRLVRIGELGTPGEFGTPRVLTFEVPELPAGDYTAAIWFKGYATGTWANALEGIHPLLTIGPAGEGATAVGADEGAAFPSGSDERGWPLLWAVALVGGILMTAFVALGRRRATRRRPGGMPARSIPRSTAPAFRSESCAGPSGVEQFAKPPNDPKSRERSCSQEDAAYCIAAALKVLGSN
jgi:hypothetical protein